MYKVAVSSLMQCKKLSMKCDLFHEMKEHSYDFKTVVVLQNCMGLIKDEPDSGSEAYETNLEDRTEEGNITDEDAELKMEESDIKIEEAEIEFELSEDIKEENPEAITISAIKPEPEVSCVVFVHQAAMFLASIYCHKKRNNENTFQLFLYMYCALRTVYYPDQPLHNMHINNKFLYHNVTSFATVAVTK
jgi:hypothetical protein